MPWNIKKRGLPHTGQPPSKVILIVSMLDDELADFDLAAIADLHQIGPGEPFVGLDEDVMAACLTGLVVHDGDTAHGQVIHGDLAVRRFREVQPQGHTCIRRVREERCTKSCRGWRDGIDGCNRIGGGFDLRHLRRDDIHTRRDRAEKGRRSVGLCDRLGNCGWSTAMPNATKDKRRLAGGAPVGR